MAKPSSSITTDVTGADANSSTSEVGTPVTTTAGGSKKKISLRITITVMSVLLAVTVAVITIATSYVMSRSALETVGQRQAEQFLRTGLIQFQQYLDQPARHSLGLQRLVRRSGSGYRIPFDETTSDAVWSQKWHDYLAFPMIASNFSYFHVWLQTADGGIGRTRLFAGDTVLSTYISSPVGGAPDLTLTQGLLENERRLHISNMSEVVHGDSQWYNGTEGGSNYPFPDRNGLRFGYWTRAIAASNRLEWFQFWDTIAMTAIPQRQIITIACALHNESGTFLGHSSIGVNLRQLNDFLSSLSETTNTKSIAVDGNGYVLASSASAEVPINFVSGDPVNVSNPNPSQCTATPPTETVRPGYACRYHATDFSDVVVREGIRAAPRSIEQSTQSTFDRVMVDDETYFVASSPLQLSVMNGMTWRLVLLLPESDILGGVTDARNVAVYITIAVVVVAAAVVFVSIYSILKPVKVVADDMKDTARLQTTAYKPRATVFSEIDELQCVFDSTCRELQMLRMFVPQNLFGDGESFTDDQPSEDAYSSADNPFDIGLRSREDSSVEDSRSPSVSGRTGSGSASVVMDYPADAMLKGGGVNLSVLQARANQFQQRRVTVVRYKNLSLPTADSDTLQDYTMQASSVLIPCATRYEGVIESFKPDSILVSFNAHKKCANHTDVATRCALDMERVVKKLFPFDVFAIVVDTTTCAVGTSGCGEHLERTVLGECVDFTEKAASLMTHLHHSTLLVTDRVARVIRESKLSIIPIDLVKPKWQQPGRQDIVVLHLVTTATISPHTLKHYKKYFFSITQMSDVAANAEELEQYLQKHTSLPYAAHQLVEHGRWLARQGLDRQESYQFGRDEVAGWAANGSNSVIEVPDKPAHTSEKVEDAQDLVKQMKQDHETENTLVEPDSNEVSGLFTVYVPVRSADESGDTGDIPETVEDTRGVAWSRGGHRIGGGASGHVYSGISRSGSLAALKLIPLHSTKTDVEEISKEITTFASLQHDNIVSYYGCALLKSHVCIITELVAGGSLFEVLRNYGYLPASLLRRYVSDILSGLHYLHTNGVVHSDIKPQNILLAPDGSCKLTDFGSSVNHSNAGGSGSNMDTDVGGASKLIQGTVHFAAPEVCNGEAAVPASDIWSVGITTMLLATGCLPWPSQKTQLSQGVFATELANDKTMVPRVQHFSRAKGAFTGTETEHLPEEFHEFVRSCCTRDPSMRPTAASLLSSAWLL